MKLPRLFSDKRGFFMWPFRSPLRKPGSYTLRYNKIPAFVGMTLRCYCEVCCSRYIKSHEFL